MLNLTECAQAPTNPSLSLQNVNAMPAAPATLVSALALIDDLNKRLSSLRNRTIEVAQAIGGPYPVSGQTDKDPPPRSAMQKLNDGVQEAHGAVTELETAMDAIRRSLGG